MKLDKLFNSTKHKYDDDSERVNLEVEKILQFTREVVYAHITNHEDKDDIWSKDLSLKSRMADIIHGKG